MSDAPDTATGPIVTQRTEQPYVWLAATTSMDSLGQTLPPLIPQVMAFLGGRDEAPAGAPFWRYRVIDMPQYLEVEVGVPTATALDGDGTISSGVLPGGRYATVSHEGDPAGLVDATRRLLEWADRAGEDWDVTRDGERERWGCRLEEYLTDPAVEPDRNRWITRLAFRLADKNIGSAVTDQP